MILLSGTKDCFAYQKASEHHDLMESILFEDGYSKYDTEIKKHIEELENASTLTIDQWKGDDKSIYDDLKKSIRIGLPSFDTINYTVNFISGKQVGANTHRMFTHEGWERDYTSIGESGKKAQKFWNARRKVLLLTVEHILDFGNADILGFDEKCNSMAGIIYYIHILGDYDEPKTYKSTITQLTRLACRSNPSEKDKDYDMIYSLKKYVENLFSDQKSDPAYKDLMKGFTDIEKKVKPLVSTDGLVKVDKFEEYKNCVKDTITLLQKDLPVLLKNEEHFKKVFYS